MKHCDHPFHVDKEVTPYFCSVCQFSKSHMQHFPSIETSTTQLLELFLADLWGLGPLLL